ncbi:hypothetical protein ACERII_11295 [Evansella sp. AB-rgal1]|uniref:hypothetical protein n=1 Tax=Evansella sp. AB-rgal1 TaxID=3242696 RepID=UPI00359E1DA6
MLKNKNVLVKRLTVQCFTYIYISILAYEQKMNIVGKMEAFYIEIEPRAGT